MTIEELTALRKAEYGDLIPALFEPKDLEYHEGPIKKGDVIIVEINGKIVPKRPWDPSPQWFVALVDAEGNNEIPMQPMRDSLWFKPRIYRVDGGKL